MGFFATTFAQEAFDKKWQVGIALGTGFNMNKTTSLLKRDGVGFDQTLGLNLNYNLNPTLTVTTGLEFDFESFKYTANDTILYVYNDQNITKKAEFEADSSFKDQNLFKLNERQYKTTYLILPIFATLKTKPFGNMQYFGKFGTRIGIKTGGRINDTGVIFAGDSLTGKTSIQENSNMVLEDDIRSLKINAGVSAGVMWNFSGTTMLVSEIGYFFGLTQMHMDERTTGEDKKRSYTLIDSNDENSLSKITKVSDIKWSAPAAKQGQILIKFTLFF